MSSPLDHLISSLEAIGLPLEQFGKELVTSPAIARVMTNLNREQMNAGLRGDGTNITPEYTQFTKYLKAEKGQETDFVTLRDTGEYQADLRVEFSEDQAEIKNDNEKAGKLASKYGAEILGLMDESEERVKALLLPNFNGYVRQELLPKLLER